MRRLLEDSVAWIVAGIILWFVAASFVEAIPVAGHEEMLRANRVYSDDSTCEGWDYLDSTGDVPKFDRSGF